MLEAKIARWLCFGVFVALAPFMASYLLGFMRGRQNKDALKDLFGRGELMLVSAAIGAGAIGELIGAGKDHAVAKIIVGGITAVLLFLQALMYYSVSDPNSTMDRHFAALWSMTLSA